MSVSTLPAKAAAARGELVSNRHYVAKLRCPWCSKVYAKRSAWQKHLRLGLAGHTKGRGR